MTDIDWLKVEQLRARMLLSASDMADLFGVSRVTYYAWVRGNGKVREQRKAVVKQLLRDLIAVIKEHGWPSEKVQRMKAPARLEYLKSLLEQLRQPEAVE